MKKDYRVLLEAARQKVYSAVNLVQASVKNLDIYDPGKNYSPEELEPYDALSDRFIRAVETCIKFFKTYEYYLFTISSDTYRDLLLNMEKQEMLSSSDIWIDMRDIRNRIVHDYLPQDIKNIFDQILGEFKDELFSVNKKIKDLRV